MLGETDENWRPASERTLELEPDSVTIYQMELPYNTTISRDLLKGTSHFVSRSRTGPRSGAGSTRPSARWSAPATTSAAPTPPSRIQPPRTLSIATASGKAPISRASAWRRSVTSTACTSRTRTNGTPGRRRSSEASCRLARAYRPTDDERMIREFILQLKRGALRPDVFRSEVRRRSARAVSATDRRSGRRRSPRRARRGSTGAHARGLLRVDVLLQGSSCPSTPTSATPRRRPAVTPLFRPYFMATTDYDVIVIGGGPAGCHRVHAHRPARPPRRSVRARTVSPVPHRRIV